MAIKLHFLWTFFWGWGGFTEDMKSCVLENTRDSAFEGPQSHRRVSKKNASRADARQLR